MEPGVPDLLIFPLPCSRFTFFHHSLAAAPTRRLSPLSQGRPEARPPAFRPALEGVAPPHEFPRRVAQPVAVEDALLVLTARIRQKCR